MDSNSNSGAFVATDSAGSVSSSPPVIIRASPSYDSDDDNNLNFKTALKSNINSDITNGTSNNSVGSSFSSSSSSSVVSSNEDEDGGFVSGEEEFETASEPIFADPDDETLEKFVVEEEEEEGGAMVDAPSVESSQLPLRPIAKLSVDDEDDDVVDEEAVGNPVVRVRESGEGIRDDGSLGKTDLVGDNEVKFEEKKDENGVEGDNFENASSDAVVSGNEELVDANGVKFTSEGDSVVEDINADITEPGVVTVGDIGESKESEETSAAEVQVGENDGLHVDEGIREIDGVKVTAEGDSVVEEIHADVVPVSGAVIVGGMDENKEADIKGSELPVIGAAAVPEDVWDIASAVGNGTVEALGDDDEQGKATDAVASSEAELIESKVAGATDDAEFEDGQKALVKDIDEDFETKVAAVMHEDDQDTKMDSPVESGTIEVAVVDDDDKRGKTTNAEDFSEPKLNESIVAPVTGFAESVDVEQVPIKDEDGHPETKVDDDKLSRVSDVPATAVDRDIRMEVENDSEDSVTDEETDGMIFGSSEAAKKFLEELEQESAVAETSRDNPGMIDGQIVTDSDEEVETDEEEEDGKELFDSAALAALLKAATGGAGSDNGGTITITSQDGSRLFSVERPAGLGSSLRPKPSLAARSNRPNIFSSGISAAGDSETNLSEEEKKKLENIQQLRVKFLRLVHRLGHSTEDSVAAQVLYRLGLVGRTSNPSFSLEAAKRMARDLEAEGKDNLSFSINILVLGKTGVGKSATINSIFGEEKARIDAFEPTTNSVKKITGVVDGVTIHVYDTPGLRSSVMEQGTNRKILALVKSFTKKCPPDIVLYVDRLDAQTRDLNDLPLLKTISSTLGPSIWRSAIVTLTHAGSAPPDGPSGTPLTYEGFVAQRSHIVQQSVGQAVGDLRLMNPTLMNPVSLVENHPSCRKNRDGQKVLPNGQAWRSQLLLLCYSMKILSEASSLSKPQDPFDPKKLFGFRMRSPPLPYLLSWLLQSRTHPKLSPDQGGDNGDSDVDLDELSDSEGEEEEDEYDQLPPFKPLRRSQISKLNKEQRKAYFEEYDYRVKLLQKKQWREELKRMRESKKKVNVTEEMVDDADQDAPAAVPVPLPDMVLPPSFDCDNPAYRYRFLEPTSDFLARPVLDTHGWDHDCGYDGVNIEQSLAIAGKFPGAVAIQLTKDKKEFSIHLDSSVAAKHGENGSSMVGFDIQNVGKQLAYVVRGETKFKNFRKNKAAAGVSVTFLGENVVPGIKIEDQIALGKRFVLVGSTGTVRSQNDAAYGANLEVRLKEADFPIGQDQSALTLSLVKWRGDLALAANFQSQFSVGRGSKVAARVQLNNKLSGQITIRTSTSDQLQIALLGIIPTAVSIYKSLWPGASENYSIY